MSVVLKTGIQSLATCWVRQYLVQGRFTRPMDRVKKELCCSFDFIAVNIMIPWNHLYVGGGAANACGKLIKPFACVLIFMVFACVGDVASYQNS